MTDPNNPLNITDDDIGKEGRFLVDDRPAVLVAIARNHKGAPHSAAFKWTHPTKGELIVTPSLDYAGLACIPRKRYIGVAPKPESRGRYGSTWAYSTREQAEQAANSGWDIIEIPHPEDAP